MDRRKFLLLGVAGTATSGAEEMFNTNTPSTQQSGAMAQLDQIGGSAKVRHTENTTVADELKSRAINFTTVAKAVASTDLSVGQKISIDERLFAVFEVVLKSSVIINGFNIIQCDGVPSLALKLDIKDVVNIEHFGARTALPSDAIQAAINYAITSGLKLYARRTGVAYAIDKPLDFRGVQHIEFLEDIDAVAITTEVAIIVGGFAISGVPDIKMAAVLNGSVFAPTPEFPTIQIFGAKSGKFQFGGTNYLQIYADAAEPTGTSNAYNNIDLLGVCRRLEYASAAGFSWNTENRVHGGRIIEYYIINGGGYGHNHNKLYDPTFEGPDVKIKFLGVSSNWIYGGRFESTEAGQVTFDSESIYNSIERSWSGQLTTREQFNNNFIGKVDNGSGNSINTESSYKFNQTVIAELNANSGIVSSASFAASYDKNALPDFIFGGIGGHNFTKAGLKNIEVSANRWIYLTDIIPVELGDAVSFDFDYDGTLLRPCVFVYDENQSLLKDELGNGAYWSQPSLALNVTEGCYVAGTDLGNQRVSGSVGRPEVKYIRVGIYSGNGGSMRGFTSTLHTQSLGRGLAESSARIKNSKLVIEGAPIQGYLPKYTPVFDTTTGITYEVSALSDTQLAAGAITGATSLTVDDTTWIANGDIIGVLLDNGKTHWSAVSALAGNSFTVVGLPSGAKAGNRLVSNRFTAI